MFKIMPPISNKKIETIRKELHELADSNTLTSQEVIELSRKLDVEIMRFLRKKAMIDES